MSLSKDEQDALNALTGNREADTKNGSSYIAKYLFEDFLYLLNVSMMKLLCQKIENPEEYINGIIDVWRKRTSEILKSETKKFQDTIFKSIQSAENIDEEFQKKMNDYFSNYCIVRDNAFEMAKQAIDNIKSEILRKDPENHENN